MKSISQYLEADYKKWNKKNYIWTKQDDTFKSKTFGEVIQDVWSISKALLSMGLKNKNIMIYSENSYEWIVFDLSIMGYVGVSVPIDKEWTHFDIANTLKKIEISTIIYSKAKQQEIDKVKKEYQDLHYICIETEFDALLEQGTQSKAILQGEEDLDKIVKIMFTSGTTSKPKAIPSTQKNMLANWDVINKRTPMNETDTSYLVLPLSHVYGAVTNFLYTIISGMELYLCTDLNDMIEDIKTVKPSILCMVPLMIKRMYDNIDKELIAVLKLARYIYCGGSYIEREIKQYFIDKKIHLVEAYGATETTSAITVEILGENNIASSGKLFETIKANIINQDKEGVGELIVKGDSVVFRYLNEQSNYKYFDAKGYYHTGDLAKIDEAGNLYIKGRKRRVIITGNAKNVYPDEIEALILENKEINKVKVYEEDYHIVAAIYSDLEEAEVRTFIDKINRKLPKYKKVKKLYIYKDVLGIRLK